jgi:hypothetical protein
MNTYSVIDTRPDLRLAALRDAMGRRYVVRLSAEQPEIGAELSGGALERGARVRLLEPMGQVFDVTVDASECTEQYVFERLHVIADAPVSGAAARPTSRAARRAPAEPADIWTGLVPARR